jgi:Tol biopolymer transport system component
MDNLDDLLRGFRSGVRAPSGDAVSAARELLRREIGSFEPPRPSRPRRPWKFVALAAAILVGGLLVAPAVAIGDHLLELLSGKSTSRDVQTPAWSPDGRKLAFVSRRDGNSEIYVMNADGSEQENLTRQPANDSHPSWSRDGRKLVFVSRRDGNAEIYVMNADGSGLRNLTRAPSDDLDPAWSPDGRAVAFVQKKCVPSRPCGTAFKAYLAVVNADGSGLRRLTTRPAHLFNPSWSADGKTIRYGRSLVNADGSGSSELPRNVPLAGAWSPDGQRIAVVSVAHGFTEARNPSKLGLWVMNADGSNARRVAAKATSGEPAWSPDGRRIAFRRYDRQPQVVPGRVVRSAGPSALFVVNADGSGLRRLTRNAENLRWFAWSPDGRTIAFLRNREVYIVKADGSAERRLTQLDK